MIGTNIFQLLLPIEMEMAMKQQDGAELLEKEQDITESGWDPDEIAKYTSMMSKVKEVIHSKAKRNIDDAKKKTSCTMIASTPVLRYVHACIYTTI